MTRSHAILFHYFKNFFQMTWYCRSSKNFEISLGKRDSVLRKATEPLHWATDCLPAVRRPVLPHARLLCSLRAMVAMAHPTTHASTVFSWLTAVRWLHMLHRKRSPAEEPHTEEQTESEAQAVNQVRWCNNGKICIWCLMMAKNSLKMTLFSSVKYTRVLGLLIS